MNKKSYNTYKGISDKLSKQRYAEDYKKSSNSYVTIDLNERIQCEIITRVEGWTNQRTIYIICALDKKKHDLIMQTTITGSFINSKKALKRLINKNIQQEKKGA